MGCLNSNSRTTGGQGILGEAKKFKAILVKSFRVGLRGSFPGLVRGTMVLGEGNGGDRFMAQFKRACMSKRNW